MKYTIRTAIISLCAGYVLATVPWTIKSVQAGDKWQTYESSIEPMFLPCNQIRYENAPWIMPIDGYRISKKALEALKEAAQYGDECTSPYIAIISNGEQTARLSADGVWHVTDNE